MKIKTSKGDRTFQVINILIFAIFAIIAMALPSVGGPFFPCIGAGSTGCTVRGVIPVELCLAGGEEKTLIALQCWRLARVLVHQHGTDQPTAFLIGQHRPCL